MCSLERQLFDWDGWDGDLECMVYYNPVLKVQIGNFPPETKFNHVVMMFAKSLLRLYYNDLEYYEYKLSLSVSEVIKE